MQVTFESENTVARVLKVRTPIIDHTDTVILTRTQFEDAGLHPIMLDNIKLCQYDVPTPIQQYVLPAVLQNLDVIGVAQTGKIKRIFVTLSC